MIHWEKRTNKAKTRRLLLSRAERLKEICYLGLPGDSAIFERQLSNTYKCSSMHLVENKKEIFLNLSSNIPRINCSNIITTHGDIDETIKSPLIKPNFIWLDYCGQITSRRLHSLNLALGMVRKTNGILATTYLAGREDGSIQEILRFFGSRAKDATFDSFIEAHHREEGAISLPVLSRLGGCPQKELKLIFNDFVFQRAGLRGYDFKKTSGRRVSVWAEDLSLAKKYYEKHIVVPSKYSNSLPYSLIAKAKSVAEIATFYSGPLSVTVQPYLDKVSMLLFLFEFDSSLSKTKVEILPYLKGV